MVERRVATRSTLDLSSGDADSDLTIITLFFRDSPFSTESSFVSPDQVVPLGLLVRSLNATADFPPSFSSSQPSASSDLETPSVFSPPRVSDPLR